MITNGVSVTHGSWMRMTASWVSLATRNSCLKQKMARPLTRKRGNERSKNNRTERMIENKIVKMSVMIINRIVKMNVSRSVRTSVKIEGRVLSQTMTVKVGNLYQPISHTCRMVVTTKRKILEMTEMRNKTHR